MAPNAKIIRGTQSKPYMIWSDSWGCLDTFSNMRDVEASMKGGGVAVPNQKPHYFMFQHKPIDQKPYQWNWEKQEWEQIHF